MSQQTGTKTARRISAEEAAGLIRSGMWLDYGAGLDSSTPSMPRWRRAWATSMASRSGPA
ncbi:MAG: hypothetical protein U0R78_15465 [Nocardioidaceae bacterium]